MKKVNKMCKSYPKTFLKRFYLSGVSLHNENHSNFKAGLSDDFARTLWGDTHLVTGLFDMEEIWKPVVGMEGFYEISEYGKLRSVARIIYRNSGRKQPCKEKLIKGYLDKDGYLKYAPSIVGKRIKTLSHRLVAFAFIPNPQKLPQINHKDGNKLNNHYSNLEWCTNHENILHAEKIGLRNSKGSANYFSSLNEEKVRQIKELMKLGVANNIIAIMFNVQPPCISKIKKNLTWRHVQ